MDNKIIVALIAAIGAILAAVIPILIKRHKSQNSKSISANINVGNVHSGGDSVIAGGDALVIQQKVLEDRFISRKGGKLIIDVSREVISDEQLRQRWSSFDAKFLANCIKDTPRGIAFDGETFQEFRKSENDQMFSLGVLVYTACCKKVADKSNPDYVAFNKISQIYLSARMVLRDA